MMTLLAFHESTYTPLAVFGIPAIILVVHLIVKNGKALKALSTKVDGIDHAVNNQPPGTKPMVEKVSDILTEQERVANELSDIKNKVVPLHDQDDLPELP